MAAKTHHIAILISTKNRCKDLIFTLQKISAILALPEVSCVVFDDGSNDGTFESVQTQFPEITLLRNEVSKGYLFCRNKMLNETTADYAVSLDDDAHFLSENPVSIIRNHFEKNHGCGLIAFRLFWGKSEPESLKTSDLPQIVKSFVGCGHAWRMAAWREIQNYPEWFKFYGEETFASLELTRKNWEVHYVPEILVLHRVEMQTRKVQKDFNFRYRRSLRADWHLYFLFYPMPKIPRMFAYSLLMQLKKIFKGNFRIAIPIFRALADVVFAIPNYFRYRNALTDSQYLDYSKRAEPKIYWKPENHVR